MQELRREILRGHEILLDYEPPYPSGSFRFLDADLAPDGRGVELWCGLALYMQIDPDSIGRTDDEAMASHRELQPLAGAASSSVAAIYWRRLWELGRDVGDVPARGVSPQPGEAEMRGVLSVALRTAESGQYH